MCDLTAKMKIRQHEIKSALSIDNLCDNQGEHKMARILVLDDDETRLRHFRQKLIGNVVECIKTAQEAIRLLSEEEPFDLLFLDHDLGDKVMVASGPGTGYEVAEWIRDHKEKRPKDIVIHSYNPAGADNMRAILPGAHYKPGIWLSL